jgi:uncharacterized membrane protein YeaQ/YmgE (transglycosylase-associated protein family)
MPITPFHLGPAVVVKAVLRDKFSITIFGFSQILIDLQPLFSMLGADIALHGLSHTYLGATVIAIIAGFIGRPLCQFFLRWWNRHLSTTETSLLIVKENFSWSIAFSSAFIGTYSHILLDSIMHADLIAFYPLNIKNSLLGLVPIDTLHVVCFIAGIIGAVIYFGTPYFLKWKYRK